MKHLLTAAALGALALPLQAQTRSVEYEVAFPNAEQHEARVTATFRGVPRGQPLQIRMSRSSPGRYALHNFAKNVYDVEAVDGQGRRIALARPDAHGWDAAGHDGTVRVSYTVWGDRVDGTYAGIDRTHAHLNVPATFAFARGMDDAPVRLTVRPRPGWRVATQLRPTADSTVFTAPSWRYFADSPVEVGPVTFREWRMNGGGRSGTIRLAVHHLGDEAQVDSFAAMVRRVVDEEVAVWGEPAAYDFGTYTFLADYLPWAAGDGMEHRNSTVVTSRRPLTTRADRLAVLGTVAHEFFHSWNVERLRPRSLEPFDLERENVSPELWFAEGVTSYYDGLVVRRAGFTSDDEFAANLSGPVNTVLTAPGRRHASAAEMSAQAPFSDAAVSIDPTNRQNTFVSYYTWGEALGIALDLSLRTRFGLTMDEFMRTLWARFGREQTAALSPAHPYTLAELRTTLGAFTRDTAFANDFFRRYVEGREAADYERLLGAAGFLVQRVDPASAYLGASLADDSAGVAVNGVLETGSLFPAGIASGDRIHAVNGEAVASAAALAALISRHRPGEVVRVDVTTRGGRMTVPVTLRERPDVRVITYESAGRPLTDAQRALRQRWLASRVAR